MGLQDCRTNLTVQVGEPRGFLAKCRSGEPRLLHVLGVARLRVGFLAFVWIGVTHHIGIVFCRL